MTADRPATEPRTKAGRDLHALEHQRSGEPMDSEVYCEELDGILAIEAEAAHGAAPRPECGRSDVVTTVEGRELVFRCDREGWDHPGRHHATNVEGVEIFWGRGSEGAAPRAEGLARSTPAEALDVPEPLHPNVEDADYNCPNEWCQRFWAMVREAEDRAGADRGGLDEEIEARAQGGPSVIDVDALADAYHRYRTQYPGGTIFCGTEHGPFEFDSAACTCRMDIEGTLALMDR